jgi:hypothetical protein
MFELIGNAKAQWTNLLPISPIDANTGIEVTVGNILTLITWLAGVLAVVYLIYSGILYITAGGDAEKATKGRTGVINAVIGIIIILLALLIISWVRTGIGA